MKVRRQIQKLFIISLSILWISPSNSYAENRGVFIGTSDYEAKSTSNLPDTRFDANDMSTAMIQSGTLNQSNSRIMTGANKKDEILGAIREQGRNMGPGDTLIIYNSSHGSTRTNPITGNKESVIVGSDKDITPAEMSAVIAMSGAGNVIFINDSCFSGGFTVNVPGKNITHLNASDPDQISYISNIRRSGMGHGNSAFTREIIEGLTNNQADLNGDGKITTDEMNRWARGGIKTKEPHDPRDDYYNTKREQNPNMVGGDIEIPTSENVDPNAVDIVLVPRIINKTPDVATGMIVAEGLVPSKSEVSEHQGGGWRDESWVGKVVKATPGEGTSIKKGFTVSFDVLKKDSLVTVPLVIGMKASEAFKTLRDVGLKTKGLNLDLNNNIRFQDPAAGTKIIKGSIVRIAKGADDKAYVPHVLKMSLAEGKKIINATGVLVAGAGIEEKPPRSKYKKFPPNTMNGKIWKTLPKGGKPVANGTNVSISYSPGDNVKVPNIQGMTETEARRALTAAGLVMNIKHEDKITVNPAGVFDFLPQPQAYAGDTIVVAIQYPEIPNLTGKTFALAEAACNDANILFNQAKKIIMGNPNYDKVAEQTPVAGGKGKPWVTVVTGYFPEPKTKVPNLQGMDQATAQTALINAGLIGAFADEKPTPDLYASHPPPDIAGKVWKQSPVAGHDANVDSTVNASLGPAGGVRVPGLSGMSESEAKAALSGVSLNFTMGNASQKNFAPRGVFAWNPQDYAYQGDNVTVDIEYPEVPDLSGRSQAEAEAAISNAGLTPNVSVEDVMGKGPGVYAQNPGPGTKAHMKDPVTAQAANPAIQETEVIIPSILNMDTSAAKGILDPKGITVSFTERKPPVGLYDQFPPPNIMGKVWNQSPAPGTKIPRNPDSPYIPMTASIGPPGGVNVPFIGFMTDDGARAALQGVGLSMAIKQFSQTVFQPNGVESWNPMKYAYQGDTVSVTIEFPEVPNLHAKSIEQATAAITGARLVPNVSEVEVVGQAPGVFAQKPTAGGRAKFGATVSARVAKQVISDRSDDDGGDGEDPGVKPPPGWSPTGPTIAGPDVPPPDVQEKARESADKDVADSLERDRKPPESPPTTGGSTGGSPYDGFTMPDPPPVYVPPPSQPSGTTPSQGGGESGHGHGAKGQDIPKQNGTIIPGFGPGSLPQGN